MKLLDLTAIDRLIDFYSEEATDTIRYDFYLKDRALNESNVASTSEIVISVNNVYVK